MYRPSQIRKGEVEEQKHTLVWSDIVFSRAEQRGHDDNLGQLSSSSLTVRKEATDTIENRKLIKLSVPNVAEWRYPPGNYEAGREGLCSWILTSQITLWASFLKSCSKHMQRSRSGIDWKARIFRQNFDRYSNLDATKSNRHVGVA